MVDSLAGSEIFLVYVNVVSLALCAVPPALLLAYARQSLAARHIRREFSLRPSEAAELHRALLLYDKVCRRLADTADRKPLGLWSALLARRPDIDRGTADERADLQAHAHHLRATIVRLRGLPLERLRIWLRSVSLRFALGNALLVHVETFTLLLAVFYSSLQPAWQAGTTGSAVWYPFDERIFHANAIAAGMAALLGPIFYLLRRRSLRHEYGLEFQLLRALAEAGPDQKIEPPQADATDRDVSTAGDSAVADSDEPWFDILGVTPFASLEQVREAYKALIRHMSPAIKNVAEAEAKKLNVAYEQAQAALT